MNCPPVLSVVPAPEGVAWNSIKYQQRIVLNPEVRFGKPIVRGTRITVADVLLYLASGMNEDELLTNFPQLERDDIRACLVFAAERERRLVSAASG